MAEMLWGFLLCFSIVIPRRALQITLSLPDVGIPLSLLPFNKGFSEQTIVIRKGIAAVAALPRNDKSVLQKTPAPPADHRNNTASSP